MEVDLTTVVGISAVAWILTEFITHWAKQLQQAKQLVALILCLALGIGSRLSGIGFVNIPWLTFLLNLIVAIIGAQMLHDKVAKPIGLNFSKAKPVRRR